MQWKRNHEIAHLRLHPTAGAGGAAVDGVLYRGLFLRQSREGTLTLPMTPPVALPLPFDVGVVAEVGHLHGALSPEAGGPPLDVGIFHGEVLADFWRSRQPGRWLTLGVGGRYEVGLQRDDAGALDRDHRVSPMSTLAVALHSERADGLAAAAARRGVTPLVERARLGARLPRRRRRRGDAAGRERSALALFASPAPRAPRSSAPEMRVMAGVRFSQPLH